MTVALDIVGRLAEVIGSQRVVSAAEELTGYAVDGLVPSAIVRPASAEEAAEVVRFAVEDKLAVVALGSRSKSEIGVPLEQYKIAIDTTALRGIAHFDPGDLTLGVEAGMPLRELEAYLRERKQFLPLAVPCFESTTVGGTIATGIDSVLRMQYGSVRDFLIGAEFVDGTGQLCKSGGQVVKNVTGYDLHKLLIGSLGTLGVITRVNFKTFPLPDQSGGLLACFGNHGDALEYRKAVEQAGLPLCNLEALDPNAAEMIRAILQKSGKTLVPELGRTGWHVYCSFEGNEKVVNRIGKELEGIARKREATHIRILETGADETLGGMLRESFEWLRYASPANLVFRVAVPEVKPTIVSELSNIAVSAALRSALLVRAGGIVYFSVLAKSENEAAMAGLAKTVARVRSVAKSAKGHATLLHAPLTIKKQPVAPAMSGAELDMQSRVKRAFDPSGVFAPGRIVGGI
jgi:FAD/FMN-containing dehydrogenase